MEREGEAAEQLYRAKEQRKLLWAIVTGFTASGLLMLFTVGVITGSLTGGLAIALATIVFTLLVAAALMDVAWEGWGIQLFTAITFVIVMLLILNIIFGRQVMP